MELGTEQMLKAGCEQKGLLSRIDVYFRTIEMALDNTELSNPELSDQIKDELRGLIQFGRKHWISPEANLKPVKLVKTAKPVKLVKTAKPVKQVSKQVQSSFPKMEDCRGDQLKNYSCVSPSETVKLIWTIPGGKPVKPISRIGVQGGEETQDLASTNQVRKSSFG